jgi:hypothetical protein
VTGGSASRTLRALLVGIDAYEAPVPALNGCVNDIEQVATWLTARAAAAGDQLELKVLRNQEAGRDAVIEAFREHLCATGPEDTAMFYYSGHGSQERAVLPEHLAVEPDGLNETLVLADSRRAGVPDLADKELEQLVGEVAAKAGHVLLVLDCCHSGSGVRSADEDGIAVRRAPPDPRPRTPESYLAGSGSAGQRAVESRVGGGGANYVLLAACQAGQTAKEVRVDGKPRGAFSVALERSLAGLGGRPSYLDVQRTAAAAVRNLAAAQWPALESPRSEDVRMPFLGGVASPATQTLTASFLDRKGWVLDAGRMHGIAPRTPDAPTEVSLRRMGPDPDAAPLTTAQVIEVGAVTSTLEVVDADALDRATTYRAQVTKAGQPQASVAVVGAGAVADELRDGIRASTIVALADPPGLDAPSPDILISCDAEIRMTRPGSARPLVEALDATDPTAPARAVRTAEHIGRWIGIAQRQNPSSLLGPDQVRLTARDAAGDELGLDGPIELSYTRADDGSELEPTIRIEYTNSSARELHCAVLVLSELYGVACLTTGGAEQLPPGSRATATGPDGDPLLQTFVPDGQERTTDLLKLLVSSEPFDAQLLAQDDLREPTRTRGVELDTANDRGIGGRPLMPSVGPEWATRELLITTVRPGEWRSVPGGQDARIELAAGVELRGHSGLTATARLSALPTASRDARFSLLPPVLLEPGNETEPPGLAATRSVGEELAVLELDDVGNAASVTDSNPLRLWVDRQLRPGEHVLPVAFDGEDYLPLGHAVEAHGGTEIRLSRLPAQTLVSRRSLGGSLKILFRKLVSAKLGAGFPYPLLSVISYESGVPRYQHDPAVVREAVANAGRLLLVVHGILGDTRGMTAFLGADPDPIRQRYDAVLALDYENINTPVGETAAALAARIADAGLTEGRRIDVVAHSMGGLVSRWWIERAGGATAVRRLVTCGTPHQGSPWPRVQDIATAALALGLNGLGPLGTGLGALLGGVELLDDALDGMRPGSATLTELARSEAPSGVTYVAITGDQPFGAGGNAARAGRILGKLRLAEAAQAAEQMIFDGTPNDIAVSTASASGVGQGWPVRPEVLAADCNHFEYFAAPSAVTAVRRALGL